MPTSSDLSLLTNSTIMAKSTHTQLAPRQCSSFVMRTHETWTVDAEQELNSTLFSINCDHDYLGNVDFDYVDSTTSDNVMDTSFFIATSGTEECTNDKKSHRPGRVTHLQQRRSTLFFKAAWNICFTSIPFAIGMLLRQ